MSGVAVDVTVAVGLGVEVGVGSSVNVAVDLGANVGVGSGVNVAVLIGAGVNAGVQEAKMIARSVSNERFFIIEGTAQRPGQPRRRKTTNFLGKIG
jgi:hypothetical protein